MSVADKIKRSIENSSWIRKMFGEGTRRKKKYGAENVFDFSIGNPNLEPPQKFRQVLIDLINDPTPGAHRYMSNAGFESTRQAVAEYLNKGNRAQFTAEEIVMTSGAGAACNIVFKTILNPGDEVILATRNAHKTRELRALLPAPLRVLCLNDLSGAPVVPEYQPPFAGNACKKAVHLAAWLRSGGLPASLAAGADRIFVLADDSGLEVDCLGGAPGVLSDERGPGAARVVGHVSSCTVCRTPGRTSACRRPRRRSGHTCS